MDSASSAMPAGSMEYAAFAGWSAMSATAISDTG